MNIKFLVFFFLTLCSFVSYAQQVAITMDDPNCESTSIYSNEIIDQKILAALSKNNLQATLFVRGKCVDNSDGNALLQRWNKAGHTLGNHTYSHLSINSVTTDEYEADTLKNQNILLKYSQFKKIFRYPFLKEGDTLAKRDDFRKFLRANQYTIGSVTIDASDWYISDRLEKRLNENPNADTTPYKDYYLTHIWNRAQYYDNLAKEVIGRSPKHTLLVHHNLLNALFMSDLIQMFKNKGWEVIDSDVAFRDPIFKMTPNTLPAGESLIWALAKQTGRYDDKLRYPGEDETYEKDAMDKLGL